MIALLMMSGCASTTPVFDEALCPETPRVSTALLIKPNELKPIEAGEPKQLIPVIVENNRACVAANEQLRLLIEEIEALDLR